MFFFNDTATTEIYTLSLHDALPICPLTSVDWLMDGVQAAGSGGMSTNFPMCLFVRKASCAEAISASRSEEHTSELQSRQYLVCRLLLEKKHKTHSTNCTRCASRQYK